MTFFWAVFASLSNFVVFLIHFIKRLLEGLRPFFGLAILQHFLSAGRFE